jgi:hypothetical protein
LVTVDIRPRSVKPPARRRRITRYSWASISAAILHERGALVANCPASPRVRPTLPRLAFLERAGAPGRTASSTIDALLYQLRLGLAGLDEPGARARLMSCDDAAMKDIVAALRARKTPARRACGRRARKALPR